ncbi:MAG: hypothetical protein QMD66_02225 [Actinomycetota bacterium]|nr:hypothetical protein [Actinomycetota bacterium]
MYIKRRNIEFDDLYKKVFMGKGSFSIYDLRSAEGEFGLKIGENDYFGVINIGDVSGLKNN